jgi:hypothetical protein
MMMQKKNTYTMNEEEKRQKIMFDFRIVERLVVCFFKESFQAEVVR